MQPLLMAEEVEIGPHRYMTFSTFRKKVIPEKSLLEEIHEAEEALEAQHAAQMAETSF
jgi:hypothetical protein